MDLKKKKRDEEQEGEQTSVDEKVNKLQAKSKVKKKRETEKKDKSAASTRNNPVRVDQPAQTKKTPVAHHASSSDSSSSSSEEEEAPKKQSPKTPSSAPAPSRTQKKNKRRPPSSSSSESSFDEAAIIKCPSQKQPSTATNLNTGRHNATASQVTPPVEPPSSCAPKGASSTLEQPSKPPTSGSEEEIEFVIRKPVQPPGFGVGGPSSWRGAGKRGNNRRDCSARRGRGGNRGGFPQQNGTLDHDNNGAIKPSYQTDSLTNTSVVLQVCYQGFQRDFWDPDKYGCSCVCFIVYVEQNGKYSKGLQLNAFASCTSTSGTDDCFQGKTSPFSVLNSSSM